MNVFVFHARDSQGCALAALVRHCDVELRFQYLPVDAPDSVGRMNRFLEQHNLSPDNVGLPFVVSVQPTASDMVNRSILHGPPLIEWIGNLVNAVIVDTPVAPPQLCNAVLGPFLPHTLRLLTYTLGFLNPLPSPNMTYTDQAVATASVAPPMTISEIVTDADDEPQQQQISQQKTSDSEPEEDEEGAMVWANTDKTPLPRRNRERTVNISQIMMESKTREKMNSPNNRRAS
jgi:hypothetical protein